MTVSYDRAVRAVIKDGEAPVRPLPPRFSVTNLVNADRPDGNGPDSALFDTANALTTPSVKTCSAGSRHVDAKCLSHLTTCALP